MNTFLKIAFGLILVLLGIALYFAVTSNSSPATLSGDNAAIVIIRKTIWVDTVTNKRYLILDKPYVITVTPLD